MYRALIVEDEDLMREYLSAHLSELCPEWQAAATAADGIEAAELLAHERFDGILTDIRMPGMDGIELARLVRGQSPELPILILSGYDEFAYARAAMRLNVFDYLLKPINEDELSAALSAMAAQVAVQKQTKPDELLTLALQGDLSSGSRLALQMDNRACGLLLLAPAADSLSALETLYQAAQGLGEQSARLPEAVAILCATQDSLLLTTEMRHTAQAVLRRDSSLQTVGAGLSVALARLGEGLEEALRLLRLAFVLHLPFLSPPLLLEQRQAQSRLETMERLLNEALSKQALTSERCASLAAALDEFLPGSRKAAATMLLRRCECDEGKRAQALQALARQDSGLRRAFVGALGLLQAGKDTEVSILSQKAQEYLQRHFSEPVSLTLLADALHVSPAYLSAVFHREIGQSYSQTLLKLRMEDAARRLLENPGAKIYDIALAVGFPSAKHFTHVFGQYYRMTPMEFRSQNAST